MFDKYYKSQYLKIKEYEKISNVSFEKFVSNIIKTESQKYPKRKKSTKWIMMLLSFCFGMFIVIEIWNLFLWLGRDIFSIKSLLILGIPSIFVSGILLRWIFSNDLTHIDLAKFHIVDNNISLSELYLNHIISTEIIEEYSKDCTDDIIKILSNNISSNSIEEDKHLNEYSNEENNKELKDFIEENESISSKNIDLEEHLDGIINSEDEDIVKSLDNTKEALSNNNESLDNEIVENNDDIENTTVDEVKLDTNTSNEQVEETHKSNEEIIKDSDVANENLKSQTEIIYDKSETSKKLKEVLIVNSLSNIDSAKILLKDIIAIDAFEKSSPEDSLNKSLKNSICKEFKDFISDESIIW